MAFWRDNTAQSHPELMINNMVIEWMRMVNRGMLPMFQTSPSSRVAFIGRAGPERDPA